MNDTPSSKPALGAPFHGMNALQAVLKGVPYIGASLEQFIFGPMLELRVRRTEDTLREVAEALHAKGAEDNVASEKFVQLLEHVAPGIARATVQSRRQRFSELLIRAGTLPADSAKWADAELAAELLTELNDPALAVLAALSKVDAELSWALVSLPAAQLVLEGDFHWDAPQMCERPLGYQWIVVEQAARQLREQRLIWYNSHHARGGSGGVRLAELGQFLISWTTTDVHAA